MAYATLTVQSADLRKRVEIQQRSTAQDSFGQQVTTWTTVAVVWASIETLSVRELMAAQAVGMEATHNITMRYQPIFAQPKTVAAYRILYNGRIFNIQGSDNVQERNRVIVLTAAEGLNNG